MSVYNKFDDFWTKIHLSFILIMWIEYGTDIHMHWNSIKFNFTKSELLTHEYNTHWSKVVNAQFEGTMCARMCQKQCFKSRIATQELPERFEKSRKLRILCCFCVVSRIVHFPSICAPSSTDSSLECLDSLQVSFCGGDSRGPEGKSTSVEFSEISVWFVKPRMKSHRKLERFGARIYH